jgi:DNA repair protein SbcD/Mre11
MSDLPVQLVHTSDVHLGADFGFRGEAWHGPLCTCPLRTVVRLAQEEDAQLLVIAGDLFDHNRVPAALAEQVLAVLAEFPRRCIIVPGNHDAYDEHSVYRRYGFTTQVPQVHVITAEEGECLKFEALDLSVWGKPIVLHTPLHHPLGGIPPRPATQWFVIVGHGEYIGAEEEASTAPKPSSPIPASELATVDADYIALGHWDKQAALDGGRAPAWYSGAPHLGGKCTQALLVTFGSEKKVRVSPRQLFPARRLCSG